MRGRLLAAAAALAMVVSTPAWAQQASNEPHWDYLGKYGPINWGKLDPAWKVCSDGKQQSPIDIHGAKRNKALQPLDLHYRSAQATVENTGAAIDVDFGRGSYLLLDGVRYELKSVHFHRPSEHAIKGKLFDMEAHLVHESADGKFAVISVLMNEDINAPNALLSTLWADLPKTAGQTVKTSESVNPGALLPGDRNYWTYTGSLTTPPCTEGVRWFVLQQPMTVGRTQFRDFQAALPLISSRPLQEAHGRKIGATQ